VGEPLLQLAPHVRSLDEQRPRSEQEVEEVEHPRLSLELFVALDDLS
jgi:hypothetical protein